jgi:hypothetical protein
MMKLRSSMVLAAALIASSAYAGGQTVEPMAPMHHHALFVSAEGGYSWNYVGSTNVTYTNSRTGASFSGSPTKSNSGGTGRLAFGAIHYSPSNPNLSYTGEIGWGYYGKTNFTTPMNILSSTNYMYGADLLVGVDYQFVPAFDAFFKLGGLLENVRMVRNVNLTALGNSVIDNETTTVSSVIPELKIGGTYDFTNCWGLSLAYMHAFGNSPSMSVNNTFTPGSGVTASNVSSTGAPISLDSLTLGLIYKFA